MNQARAITIYIGIRSSRGSLAIDDGDRGHNRRVRSRGARWKIAAG